MIRLLTGFAPHETPALRPLRTLEPHVTYFDFGSTAQGPFVRPFTIMLGALICLVSLAGISWLIWENYVLSQIAMGLQVLLAPIYLPGLYFYRRLALREADSEVEIDEKYQFIKYSNPSQHQNLLFHRDQIETAEVQLNLIFPYRVDYLFLTLKGGTQVCITSLVVEPSVILKEFCLPYQVRKRWINPIKYPS